MRPLYKSQAVVLQVFTGALLMPGPDFVAEIEKKLGRVVKPAEFTNDDFIRELQVLYADDMAKLVDIQEDSGLLVVR